MTPNQFRSLMSFAYTLAFSHGTRWMASDAKAGTCKATIEASLDEDISILRMSASNYGLELAEPESPDSVVLSMFKPLD